MTRLSRDDARRLADMKRYALEAISFTRGKTRADLDADRMLELALERAIEIVGEAAKNVPFDTFLVGFR